MVATTNITGLAGEPVNGPASGQASMDVTTPITGLVLRSRRSPAPRLVKRRVHT